MTKATDQQNEQLDPPYQLRQSRLFTSLTAGETDMMVLNPGPCLTYLTGLHFHLSERPVIAIFTPNHPLIMVLPELEAGKTTSLPFDVSTFPYGENPEEWSAVFRQASLAGRMDKKQIGVEPGRLRFLELELIKSAAPEATIVSAEELIAKLRMIKDPGELYAMRTAVEIAQNAIKNALLQFKLGITEKEFASELTLQILRAGSDSEIPFSPIVSAGLNGANPHATPTNRPIQAGDLLIIDWGAIYQGYISDMTRTFAIGEIGSEFKKIAQIVLDANQAGREKVKPGLALDEIDQAVREVIQEAGYGEYFIHRTGHGIGMETHEPPYVRAGNPMRIQAGMTFTIEPGIYLPERGGVRIEDDILATPDGAESLTNLPRTLETLS